MTKQGSLFKRLTAIGALSLFIVYQIVVIQYTHIHVVGHSLVVHVHPYSDSSESTHSHTKQEYAFLDTLLIRAALFFFLLSPILAAYFILKENIPVLVEGIRRFVLHIFYYRGPPLV